MSLPPAHILLVDDDAAARRMMRRVLERRGHTIIEAGDGRSGLDLARSNEFDVLLLDLRMPGELSGVDVAQALKADPTTASLPIVVVSASAHYDARELTREVGCDAFIEKPVDFEALHTAIDSVRSAAG